MRTHWRRHWRVSLVGVPITGWVSSRCFLRRRSGSPARSRSAPRPWRGRRD
uniref:hypothetical protein n=1 Tax=Herbaspirillum rhizosphaerae TaxID=346179 RepID=UPI0038BACAC7